MKSPTDITLRMTLKGHGGWVMAVDLSETTIISGSADETIKVLSCAIITYNSKCIVVFNFTDNIMAGDVMSFPRTHHTSSAVEVAADMSLKELGQSYQPGHQLFVITRFLWLNVGMHSQLQV